MSALVCVDSVKYRLTVKYDKTSYLNANAHWIRFITYMRMLGWLYNQDKRMLADEKTMHATFAFEPSEMNESFGVTANEITCSNHADGAFIRYLGACAKEIVRQNASHGIGELCWEALKLKTIRETLVSYEDGIVV